MYPTNPTLMSRIYNTIINQQEDKHKNEAVKWFKQQCLPLITGRHKFSVKHGIYLPYGASVEGPHSTLLDHAWQFRYGHKAVEMVLITMPYKQATEGGPVSAVYFYSHKRDRIRLEVTELPREWSWWYPGSTAIYAVALPGVVKLTQEIADAVASNKHE